MSDTATHIVEHHLDEQASKFGMWLFLFTELLLFGGLFLVYSIYRYLNQDDFARGGSELDMYIGAINTVILLTSSLSVAMSITAIQKNNKRMAVILLWITIVLALVFLVNKYFEWSHKFHVGLYPGTETFRTLPAGEGLFFLLYYFMTGLHGVHVIIGAILLGFVIERVLDGKITSENYVFQENGALYWHLVDLIWIYLFPLFYLIH